MNKDTKRLVLTLRIDRDIYEKLERLAIDQNRSMNKQAEFMLAALLRNKPGSESPEMRPEDWADATNK